MIDLHDYKYTAPSTEYLTKKLAKERADWLCNPDTYGTCLLAILCDMFGPDLLTWTPLTIKMDVEDFLDHKWSNKIFNKAMAAVSVATTDYMLNGVPQFLTVVKALTGDGADSDYDEKVDFSDLCWGLIEANIIWPFEKIDPATKQILLPPEIEQLMIQIQTDSGYTAIPELVNLKLQLPQKEINPLSEVGVDETAISMRTEKMEDLNSELKNTLLDIREQINSLPLQSKREAKIETSRLFARRQ